MVHLMTHGTTYYFTSFASKAGSIEAICPVGRGDSIPDISERELNLILSELRAAKGSNITITLDCFHAGGIVRVFNGSDTGAIRFIPLIRTGDAGDALDLMRIMMFEAAEHNPRRRPKPNVSSDLWLPDLNSFVLLAACQDFQCAEEDNFEEFLNCHEDYLGADGMMMMRGSPPYYDSGYYYSRPSQGRFTLALVKILVSEMARNAMYESVITSIGRLGRMQVPGVAV